MKIIITGASSFIGKALIQTLYTQGHEITAVFRTSPETGIFPPVGERFLTQTLSMAEYPMITGQYDAFIHLAWAGIRGPERMDAQLQANNVRYSLATLDAAVRTGCKQYMFAGSQAEYSVPTASNTVVQTASATDYGSGKLAFFSQASDFCATHGLRLTVPRLFSVYGENDYPGSLVISTLRRMLANEDCPLTTCEQLWDFLYIGDVVEAMVSLLTHSNAEGVYDIGYGVLKPLKTYILEMAAVTQTKSRLLFGAIPAKHITAIPRCPRIDAIRNATGWQPKTTFCEGILQTAVSLGMRREI